MNHQMLFTDVKITSIHLTDHSSCSYIAWGFWKEKSRWFYYEIRGLGFRRISMWELCRETKRYPPQIFTTSREETVVMCGDSRSQHRWRWFYRMWNKGFSLHLSMQQSYAKKQSPLLPKFTTSRVVVKWPPQMVIVLGEKESDKLSVAELMKHYFPQIFTTSRKTVVMWSKSLQERTITICGTTTLEVV